MKNFFHKIKESGFTIVELLISMGLLTFVMSISMNILSIVLEMVNDADYGVVLTQESNYATEHVKRLIRSSDSFIVESNSKLTFLNNGISHSLEFIGPDSDGCYILREDSISNVVSSEVCIKPFTFEGEYESEPFWEEIKSSDQLVGVKMMFRGVHFADKNESSGFIVYSQVIGRNIILN